MTNKVKEFFSYIIKYLCEEGIDNQEAVKMVAPLLNVLNQPQYQKLRGQIESSNEYQLCYRNISGGYNDGNLTVDFSFPSAKTKTYVFTFSSALKGNYPIGKEETNPEWWNPTIDITVSEAVGSATWNADKKELKKYVDELTKTMNGDNEIMKLKQEIAEKQRKLAGMTTKAS
ncbi:MAG: hypothetical protein PHF63_13015 [Herbinix sp.]|nr:hypothetical protein [Herbinix sp.]